MSRDPADSTPGASSSSGPAANAAQGAAGSRTAAQAAGSSSKRPGATTPAPLTIKLYPPPGVYAFWKSLGTPNQLEVNPRFDPNKSDGTKRYRAVDFRQDCVARCYSQQEQSRQNVRNHLRREDNLTYAGERDAS